MRPGRGSALRRTWCSRSNIRSVCHPHWPREVIERQGRFWNSGATSSFAISSSNIRRMSSASAPSGGAKSCRLPTCIGCSRDSASRKSESVGGIGSSIVRSSLVGVDLTWLLYTPRDAHDAMGVGAGGGVVPAVDGVVDLQGHVVDAVLVGEA